MRFNFFPLKHIRFRQSSLSESYSPISNPCRGWYQIFTFHIPRKVNFDELYWCLRKDETISLVLIDIGAYQNRPLDQEAIRVISQIFDFFQQNEKDIILRIVYDCEGNGLQHEPALFSDIIGHIQQLTPIIRSHTKSIFILQGVLVGSWGEMHGSKFLSPLHLKKLYELVQSAVGVYTWLAVRKPVQWRYIHDPFQTIGKIGLFDDGIFGSETNLGTYGWLKRAHAQWTDSWCPEDELSFEEILCRSVPQGGEVVSSAQMHELSDSDTIRTLQRMHITYLNCVHDINLLEIWKQKSSPWPNVSLYDYIGAHLGYRFCIRAVKLQRLHHQLRVKIFIDNTGFAPCYEEYDITLEIVNTETTVQQETLWDIRRIIPGTTEKWICDLPVITGKLYIMARQKKDGKYLRFAHNEQKTEKMYLGCIER